MKSMKQTLFIISFLLLGINLTQGQDVKIGVVDANYIMAQIAKAELPLYKTAQANVETYGKKLEEEIQRKVQEFQQQAQTYEAGAANMTEEGLRKAQQDLAQREQEIRQFQQEAQIKLQQKEAEELEPIYQEIQEIINAIAQEQSFTHILRKEVLLYEPADADISDEILSRMGVN